MSEKEYKLSRDTVVALLDYDPLSGVFVWKRSRKVAGYKLTQGHISIMIQGKAFYAHRLAWLIVHGEWPADMIDHINGVPGDNRLENLRAVSRSINLQNQRRASRNNKCGFLGVHKHSRCDRYAASIHDPKKGRQIVVGWFDTPQEAHAAYVSAKRKLHPGNTL